MILTTYKQQQPHAWRTTPTGYAHARATDTLYSTPNPGTDRRLTDGRPRQQLDQQHEATRRRAHLPTPFQENPHGKAPHGELPPLGERRAKKTS